MKTKLKTIIIMILILIMIIPLVSGTMIINEYSEKTATNQIKIYSYPKFFLNDTSQYEEIDENFYWDGEYFVQSKKNHYKSVGKNGLTEFFNISGNRFKVSGLKINNKKINIDKYNPEIVNNTLIYTINPVIYAEFSYLPTKFKSNIVVYDENILSSPTIDITYEGDNINPYMHIYDSSGQSWGVEASVLDDYYNYYIDINFENATLPLTFDPEIEINHSFIEWNGDIYYYPSQRPSGFYWRDNNPTALLLSHFSNMFGFPPVIVESLKKNYRASIRFNITPIENVTVNHAWLYLRIIKSNHYNGLYINITHLDHYDNYYPDNPAQVEGNHLFYKDIYNGTQYNTTNIDGFVGDKLIGFSNTTNFVIDLNNRTNNSYTDFAMGIIQVPESPPQGLWNHTQIAGRDNIRPSWRPYLLINYTEDEEEEITPSEVPKYMYYSFIMLFWISFVYITIFVRGVNGKVPMIFNLMQVILGWGLSIIFFSLYFLLGLPILVVSSVVFVWGYNQ